MTRNDFIANYVISRAAMHDVSGAESVRDWMNIQNRLAERGLMNVNPNEEEKTILEPLSEKADKYIDSLKSEILLAIDFADELETQGYLD